MKRTLFVAFALVGSLTFFSCEKERTVVESSIPTASDDFHIKFTGRIAIEGKVYESPKGEYEIIPTPESWKAHHLDKINDCWKTIYMGSYITIYSPGSVVWITKYNVGTSLCTDDVHHRTELRGLSLTGGQGQYALLVHDSRVQDLCNGSVYVGIYENNVISSPMESLNSSWSSTYHLDTSCDNDIDDLTLMLANGSGGRDIYVTDAYIAFVPID